MKRLLNKVFWKIILILFVYIGFFGCEQDIDFATQKLCVQLDFPEAFSGEMMKSIAVKLSYTNKGYSIVANADSTGKVLFSGIEGGVISVTTNNTLLANNSKYTFNGSKHLYFFTDTLVHINMEPAISGRFVIKEFYYAMSLTPAGNQYQEDQFVEIYNNTNEVLYADGLSIVEHQSYADVPNIWASMGDSLIVVRSIWTIPGNGTDVMVLPGKSLVLARDGFNHKSDPNGNPNSPVDLGNADFEFYMHWDTGRDLDYPQVPNLEEGLMSYRGNDMSYHNRGGSGIAIAWIPGDRKKFILDNLISSPSNSNIQFCKIPNRFIEDAVEVMWADKVNKRFINSLDAGYIAMQSGSKSGLCIRRKVDMVENGIVYYKDTNNSTEDFLSDVVPNPRGTELN